MTLSRSRRAQAEALFRPFVHTSALVLAVSGGPDSTALLMLAARWRAALQQGPGTCSPSPSITACAASRQPRRARSKNWRASSACAIAPCAGAARSPRPVCRRPRACARYRLLAEAALAANARCILTAHTLDDQAETVLFRMMRGSGLTGLGAMTPASLLPSAGETEIMLVRPLLDIPKARLLATLDQARSPLRAIPATSTRDLRGRGCAN